MNYQELIDNLRISGAHYKYSGHTQISAYFAKAADAIETLLAERDKALYDLREICINTASLCRYCADDCDCPVSEDDFDDEWPGCWTWRGSASSKLQEV